ncbi:hypothetical protein [Streptomyces beihaiensis]|uniref:Uncharacterized protein n=1 Tax=Streptomyces beihaiensis TaxID=2984495 RepID=A0ABT3U0G9_9ACTN|nr:hypothetical protein [Streptomyces beihaiensis]MCX3061780.1 hypothetical protein [Streptomyces beihaiensis]
MELDDPSRAQTDRLHARMRSSLVTMASMTTLFVLAMAVRGRFSVFAIGLNVICTGGAILVHRCWRST